MLYGIQTGFGSPQIPVAEIFARPAPSLVSPQNQKPKSNNYLTVPDSDSIRPKSVPSSPMVKRAFSRLGTITAGWGRSIRNKNTNQLNPDDKKKWISSTDCSSKGFHSVQCNHIDACSFLSALFCSLLSSLSCATCVDFSHFHITYTSTVCVLASLKIKTLTFASLKMSIKNKTNIQIPATQKTHAAHFCLNLKLKTAYSYFI